MTLSSSRHTDNWNTLPVFRRTSGNPNVKYMDDQMFLRFLSNHSFSNCVTMTNPMTYRVQSAIDPRVDSIVDLGRPIDLEHSTVVPLVVHLVQLPMNGQMPHSEGHWGPLVVPSVYSVTFPFWRGD